MYILSHPVDCIEVCLCVSI